MKFPGGRRKYSVVISPFEQHLAQALDELRQISEIKEINGHDDFLIEWRLSSSCILHSFYAVDSLLNYLAYHYFDNSDSSWYIEPEDRIFITEKNLKGWRTLSFGTRMQIVWNEQKFAPVPAEIDRKVIELKKLRNSVSHGNPCRVIFEHEFVQTDENAVRGIVYDTYPDPDEKEFLDKEFNYLPYLNKNDAQKAICIALEIIVYMLEQAKGFHFVIKTFYGGTKEFWLDGSKSADEVFVSLGIDLSRANNS
ncbi:hypothetical protein ANRL4_04576 [Anaerolineae bacterium]|nr:hypothetical protein ANRL4_04576 [Anaerolineae bacterium]